MMTSHTWLSYLTTLSALRPMRGRLTLFLHNSAPTDNADWTQEQLDAMIDEATRVFQLPWTATAI